ncbi:hypothetical protein CRUP_023670 [Coryphaenoides rupestris]|nr:hypothetical protein CRUP_023670 [Coryphaenoides rupestris]
MGRLTLRSLLDFEDKATYEVDVQAYYLGPNPTPSVCKIIIHVNDNAPEINATEADKDSLVALISTLDRDSGVNGQVHCTLYGHDHDHSAEDFGSPPLRKIIQYTIRLTDENDNVPHFSKPVYEVSVVENNAPSAFITTVEARDADLGG